MLTNKELGEYLEKIRKQKGMTLRQVDYMSDVSFSHLSMIEKGSRKALPLTLKELAKVYNIDYIDLLEKAGYIDLAEKEKIDANISKISPDMKIKIGARIKFLRNELGITQEQLANKLPNVKGKSSIANYENGSNLPSDEVKLKMCEIFNCSLDYLMCKSDIRNPEELKNVKFANAGGLDTKGLDDDDLEELQRQIEYIKKMKGKK